MTDELSLDRQVCFALYSASRAATAVYRPLLDDLGLTYPQYLVMLVLWERDGRGVREICEELNLDTGTGSPLLRRLEGLGLLSRQRLDTDERRVEVHLTDKGAALREKARNIPRLLAESTGLDEAEMVALRAALVRVTEALHSATTPHHHSH
ncbi:winged helix-turn-helix transcriptional regulator [Rhodococcus spelaei]|uniref:Winged helix-turn-helix transcriptional regulator n=1 Tax=Rhodococcus spelaei TaxID=2546320 RepID=A0A541BPG0_9NOCA|nr:MarR family winged helix-turn-helix transcriptional regulator [Rhodococcus spelaei]TQF74219.1 winged helix-turn-helix transcriptional regulator [Rhodococcus spelaei]